MIIKIQEWLNLPMNRLRPGIILTVILLISATIFWRAALSSPSQSQAPAPKRLTVALTGKYPPFSFYDRNGELAGFDVDISRGVARELGSIIRESSPFSNPLRFLFHLSPSFGGDYT